MAWTYGFHNSVNGDRLYNADQMSSIFDGLITDGVYEAVGDKLAVEPNNGMVIQIATGRGWFNKRWVNNTSEYLITLESSDVLLNRWAAICIKGNNTDAVRATVPYVKYSDFATNPVKPSMDRDETVKEYCLAYVKINAGAEEILEQDIEDTRNNPDLCGWVTGLIDQIDSNTLYTQFTALFNDWFSGLVDIIDENVETTLVNALPTNLTVTLPASGWSGNTQSVTVPNMNGTKSVIIQANSETVEAYSGAGIKCLSQSTNTLTFICDAIPTTDIKVDIVHMGV